jgi:hypothetical protein
MAPGVSHDDRPHQPSQALLTAALGGLLCVASACRSASSTSSTDTGTGTITNEDTPIPATACDGGVSPNPTVTSSTVGAITQQQFAALCQKRSGILEVQPHCGGSNACRGVSYDSETQTLTEHTCRATNNCAGYSCVVCD